MKTTLQKIQTEIKSVSTEDHRNSGKRFFKDEIKLYGAKAADVNKIASINYKSLINKDKPSIFKLAEQLFSTRYLEDSLIACDWIYRKRKEFTREDFLMFEKWINLYVSNWAICDTFCNHTMGEFLERFPEEINHLVKWTQSNNKWVRRAAAVSLIIPAKAGKFKKEIFEICTQLLTDNEDMVQKGYGWLLKALADTNMKDVYEFVLANKKIMPRTSLRYAIEKMPAEKRMKAMQK